MTPPIVYIIPPARSQLNAAFGSALIICVNARTQIQPMRIYNTEETHFGHVTQQSLKMIPRAAIPHTRARRTRNKPGVQIDWIQFGK